jgi:hypothetical protein
VKNRFNLVLRCLLAIGLLSLVVLGTEPVAAD